MPRICRCATSTSAVRAALDQVGLLERAQSLPLELSVGEQQRVGIARAVVVKPTLLIADEPTGNLDPALSLEIMGVFKRFNDVGVTVVIATHDVDIVKSLGHARAGGGRWARAGRGCGCGRTANHRGAAMIGWLTRHLQSLLFAAGRLVRAPLSTAFTVLVIAIALTLPTAFGLAILSVRDATGNFADAVDVSVYFKQGVSLEQAQRLASNARQRNGVARVNVISADDALKSFRVQSGFGAALDVLGDNPLPHALDVRPRPGCHQSGADGITAQVFRGLA